MIALAIWMIAAILFAVSAIYLLRAATHMDAEGNQVGDVKRARRIAILGMLLAAALVALGFFGTQWWQ